MKTTHKLNSSGPKIGDSTKTREKLSVGNVKPISPAEADISNTIPDKAIELIQFELGLSRQEIFDNRLLDVEDVFRSQGWKVEYDKPGYNESYPATFTFRSE